uniref:Uncharacterized protein n=1 Tax=Rhizophora mucronata TaxID=61149 RepID=A0A2P2PX63_RHIMU
MLNDMQQLKPL